MATINYLLSSSRAGLGSIIVDATGHNSNLISNVGVASYLIAPGAAQMDGAASVAVAGVAEAKGAAQMDGTSDVLMASAILHPGAAQMDGVASVVVTSHILFSGVAHMDGQASMLGASAIFASGEAHMDGRASEVVMQNVPGAGLAEYDGEASMLAKSPNIYNLYLQDNVVGGGALTLRMMYHRDLSQNIVASESTKQKLHYHVVFSNNINLFSNLSYKMRFVKVIRDTAITIAPSVELHTQWHPTLTTQIIMLPDKLTPRWHALLSLTQSLLVTPTEVDKFIWGRKLTQAIKVPASLDASTQYHVALAQLFKLLEIEAFKLRHPVALSQNIDLSQSLIGGIALKLLQKFQIATVPSPAFNYHLTLAGKIVTRDTLEHLVNALVEELFTVHDAPDRQYIAKNLLAQLVAIQPALGNKLVLKLVGNIQLSPEQLVHAIYAGDELLDGIEITALFISPQGTTTTWVMNTRTNAVTEYMNYDFHSFAQMGDRYIAADDDGLYELDGDTDDGDLIVSRLMGGYLQLNNKKLFGLKGVYIAMRGGGRFYLKLIAGDGREYVYELRAQPNLMTTKVKIGKGINTTYMAWELVTEGQDFDLDSIEFIPMTRERRV